MFGKKKATTGQKVSRKGKTGTVKGVHHNLVWVLWDGAKNVVGIHPSQVHKK